MSERRPHWTDDLIAAVMQAGHVDADDYWLRTAQIYAVIAAVEDWQKKRWASIAVPEDSDE